MSQFGEKEWPAGLLYGSMSLIALAAVTFIGIGGFYFVSPTSMNVGGELIYRTSNAANEIRAIYGGMELGLGIFYIWSLFSRERFQSALLVIAVTIGFAGLARFYGMFALQTFGGPMFTYAAAEAAGGFIALLLAIGIQSNEV